MLKKNTNKNLKTSLSFWDSQFFFCYYLTGKKRLIDNENNQLSATIDNLSICPFLLKANYPFTELNISLACLLLVFAVNHTKIFSFTNDKILCSPILSNLSPSCTHLPHFFSSFCKTPLLSIKFPLIIELQTPAHICF